MNVEALPVLFSGLFIEFEAVFLDLFDDVAVRMFINVFESFLSRYCPAQEDAALGVSDQVADKDILELMIDVLADLKTLDVVVSFSEKELFGEVFLLHIGSVAIRSAVDSNHLIAILL